MSYNHEDLPQYIKTAGKVTILTAAVGFLVFLIALTIDVGTKEFSRVSAQSDNATTSLTVLNTPPEFVWNAYEVVPSATSTPTNSGDQITWSATAFDSNGAPYFLLICSGSSTPDADYQDVGNGLGEGPPRCNAADIQWGVSASTSSGLPATVSTTTDESNASLFSERMSWFAWVCDDDANNPRCNEFAVFGPTSTPTGASSSPFHMNKRPQFEIPGFSNDGPVDPGATINFFATTTDPDTIGGEDDIFMVVCASNLNFSTSTASCTDYLSSSTIGVTANASTSYYLTPPVMDQAYDAWAFVYDEHGHVATSAQQNAYTVNNVAPVLVNSNIYLSGSTTDDGVDLVVDVPAGETPSSSIKFRVVDYNSCENHLGGDEIEGYNVNVFRSGIGSTSCAVSGDYDPNHCYTSAVPTSTWALSCTASSSCPGPSVDYMDFNCTFPLWFVADPTDNTPGNPYSAEFWSATVSGVDDDGLTGLLVETVNTKNLGGFNAMDVLAREIAYGGLEPGDDTGTLLASSTAVNQGNTSLDQQIEGTSMCETFAPGAGGECPDTNSTSTVQVWHQQYGLASTTAYGSGTTLTSTTTPEFEIDIASTTATSSPVWGVSWWGIAVPSAINYSGQYRGLNTFYQKSNDEGSW